MKVLFTTDGSACSDHALTRAMALLPLKDSENFLLGVTDLTPVYVGAPGPAAGMAVVMERMHEETRLALTQAAARFDAADLRVTTLEREGEPAAKIVAIARELGVDLIVMGSHGRNALGRLVLGSVSDAVLHQWPGAILIIRPD